MGETKQPALLQGGLRTDQLQFLRFLAFLNVYIAHAEQWIFFPYPAHHCATAAVSFFFVLSGLLTGYNAHGKQVRLSVGEEGRYMWRKIRKLYPLYILTMLYPFLNSGLTRQIAAGEFEGTIQWLSRFLINATFLQSWFPQMLGYNGSWFLGTLMFLYLFNLPMTALLNRINQSARRYFLLIGSIVGVWLALLLYCGLTRGLNLAYWHYTFPPARLGEYLVAMIFGFLLRSELPKRCLNDEKWKKILFTALEAGALLFWFSSLSRLGGYWRNESERWLLPNLVLLGVFTCGAGGISDLFRWKPLVRLGDVSFECYLIHKLVIMQFGYANQVPEGARLANAVAFLFCLGLSVGMALLIGKKRAPKK